MSEYFEYIDAYFQKQLSDSERQEFEQRCITDEEFANDVALYISSSSALRDILLEQKKSEWSKFDIKDTTATPAPVKRINYKWIAYAAAACLILAIILFPFFFPDSPQQLANNYVSKELNSLPQTMGSADSLQLGIEAYNKKNYETAIQIFQQVYDSHPGYSDALRNLGLAYLISGNFDKALIAFEELAQKKTYSNPGPFLKALTLMQRNKGNDEQAAKIILQKIVDDKLDGNKEAKKWLRDWPDK
jgi:tetratricopeptide (TPR) repeat protein